MRPFTNFSLFLVKVLCGHSIWTFTFASKSDCGHSPLTSKSEWPNSLPETLTSLHDHRHSFAVSTFDTRGTCIAYYFVRCIRCWLMRETSTAKSPGGCNSTIRSPGKNAFDSSPPRFRFRCSRAPES